MSVGKYLSLEEARRNGLLKRFAKEHPSDGNEALFNALTDAMAEKPTPKSSKAGAGT